MTVCTMIFYSERKKKKDQKQGKGSYEKKGNWGQPENSFATTPWRNLTVKYKWPLTVDLMSTCLKR